uniref:Uncharacterized protein n=1 Tax=Moniliophthora roreri TaxID=221103 RepID=A0A0W0GCZ5_MONRR
MKVKDPQVKNAKMLR